MNLLRAIPMLGAVAAFAGAIGSARAELIYGLTTDPAPALVTFDSANAGALLSTGLISGIVAGQTLRGIDFRPSTGQLYAMSSAGSAAQLYTIDLGSFAATAIGGPLTLAGSTSIRVSIDFNPVADALRVVTGDGQSYRVNPTTGALIAQDTALSPANSFAAGIAYSNSFAGATQTTLYAYNYFDDFLSTIGGINGVPSPNGGVVTGIGPSGALAFTAGIGFDISGLGMAYLSLDDANGSTPTTEFYRVDLATGAASLLGNSPTVLLDISAAVTPIPEPSTYAMVLAGMGLLGTVMRRRRASRRE